MEKGQHAVVVLVKLAVDAFPQTEDRLPPRPQHRQHSAVGLRVDGLHICLVPRSLQLLYDVINVGLPDAISIGHVLGLHQ